MATGRATNRKKARVKSLPAVTFWRNINPGEFGDKWRVDFGDGTYDWVATLADLSSWLYEKDYPRRLFRTPNDPDFVRASNLELTLLGEYDAASKIRKWHDKNCRR